MNDCLSLPLRQGPAGIRALTTWESLSMPLGEGESLGLPHGRGTGWQPQAVPRQEAASEQRQALWYRAAFTRPDHGGRVLLRFGGAFLAANVWLNGRLLGSHYGYFGPFGFDLSPFLRPDNLLVVCCESPVETDLVAKHHVMGMFADGDSRPYPSHAYFSLPDEYRWEVPLGLWAPVELEYVGAIHVDWMRLRPRLEAGDGRLDIEARLRNLDAREMSGVVGVEVVGPDGGAVRLVREYTVPGGLEQTLNATLSIPNAARWQPWRFGEANLYEATLTVLVDNRLSTQVSDRFGFRELDIRPGHTGWHVAVNGQPMFLRGANYAPAYQLDTLNEDVFRNDLKLAREAHIDALRVHAHVLPQAFYRCADEAGMLVFADFPLTGAYAYHADGEDARFFESAVREQIPEMVELLRNRPSVAVWCAHDDPPWLSANSHLADVHAVRQNYTIDQDARALFERLDPSRPALAASGDLDAHAYLGWLDGAWEEFAEAEPGFVTELGAPALPSEGSPVWREFDSRAMTNDEDPAWLYAGFDPVKWDEVEVGLPGDYTSITEYVAATQSYQGWLVRFAVEQLRKRKLEPCWGAFIYQLVDPFPGMGFGVLDAARQPKQGFDQLRHAFAPTRVFIDALGFLPDPPAGICFPERGPVSIRLVAVNDDPHLGGPARVRWTLYRDRLNTNSLQWLREAARKRSYTGFVDFRLPSVSEPAVQVTSLSLPVRGEGEYRLVAELFVNGKPVDTTHLDFNLRAFAPSPGASRPLPRYVAERLVDVGSVRGETDGFSFAFVNRTRPAVLASLDEVLVDGVVLRDVNVRLGGHGGRSSLPRRLELPLGKPVRIHVETREPLPEGEHVLELDVRIPGVANGRIAVRASSELAEATPPQLSGSA